MASLRVKRDQLYIDFRWRGVRYREATRLSDTPEHRAEVRRRVRQIDGDLAGGTFNYAKWFPQGPRRAHIDAQQPAETSPPSYGEYVRRWLSDKEPRIGAGTAYDWHSIVEGRLIPRSGAVRVSEIPEE
jgi:integrase